MATAAVTEVKDTECSVCHEEFTDPKLLSCGHLLCRHCLLSWLTSHQDAPCPLCRRAIIDPDTRQRQTLESIVDTFPTDVAMKILVESERLLDKDHACQSCTTQAASSLCLQCRDFLCSSCTAMHGRLSVSRHHNVESLSSLTAEKMAIGYSTSCQQHPKELARLYCATHQVSICTLCASSKHRNCPDIKDLEERGEETQAQLTELVTRLCGHEANLDRAIQEMDDLFQETEKKEQAAMTKISDTFDRVECFVKKSRLQVEESTRNKFTKTKTLIQDRRAHLLQKRGAVTTHRTVAERGKRVAALGDVSEMADALKKHTDSFDSSDLLSADAQIITMATLEIDPEAVSNVEKALLELGQVKVKVTPAAVAAQPQGTFFSFHDNCGKSIVLSNNQQTAERKRRVHNGGIVVSRQPMVPHRLYEVNLDERDAFNGYVMLVGATTEDPGNMTLPVCAGGWGSAVVFCKNCVQIHGKSTKTDVGKKLVDLPKGSHVGVMIDSNGCLHLYINGQDRGVAGTQGSQPCFAFFDVFGPYRKVTALPVTVIQ